MRIEEDNDAVFDDGTITIVINMAYEGDNLPEGVKEVYEYFRSGEIAEGNEMLHMIDEKVIEVNYTRKEFIMTFDQELMLERREGIAQTRNEMAIRMIEKGYMADEIADITELSKEEVEKLIEEIR